MSYPFPGMNPWLEQSHLWKDVHNTLIVMLRAELAPQLRPQYFVGIEKHTYITLSPNQPSSRYPDVSVIRDRSRADPPPALAGVAVLDPPTVEPLEIDLPQTETLEYPYLKVQTVPEGEVVTVIEILSHANKHVGENRESYLSKRQDYLNAHVNFVEVDLLRANRSMPLTEQAGNKDYRLFIRRSDQRQKALLYAFTLRDAIPTFPLPLLPGDNEPKVDLGKLLQDMYETAGYDLMIDYTRPPKPALSRIDMLWAERLLGISVQNNGRR